MRPALTALKSSSSNRWLARQAQDPFVRSRATGQQGTGAGTQLRARSGFKLSELARKYPLLHGRAVVDLGAAPGGWSQVAAKAIRRQSRRGHGGIPGAVVAVDLLPMEELEGVQVVEGDFFDHSVQEQVRMGLKGFNKDGSADTVLSDMMAAMSGVRVRDVQSSLDLVQAATTFAHVVLRPKKDSYPGGSLVLKFFMHPDLNEFRKTELEPFFTKVATDKPKASRSESSEAYWVCLGYKGRNPETGEPLPSPAPVADVSDEAKAASE